MTISRVPAGEPKRLRNGCLSILLRLAILLVILAAMIYAALKYVQVDLLYGPHVRD